MPGPRDSVRSEDVASALRIEAELLQARGLAWEHVPVRAGCVGDKNVNVVGGVNHLACP